MAFVIDKVSEDTFYENILLGLTKALGKMHHVKNVHLERRTACHVTDVALWEQMNGLRLPEDLRDFYLASNGMKVTWNYLFTDHEMLPVGLLKIRSISELNIVSRASLQVHSDLKPLKNKLYQHCNSDAKVVYLANVDDTAKVCLVYSINTRVPPYIFLVENDVTCYYLTHSFKRYLLMAIAHLGLPLWQYCFTPQGIPSWVEQMFIMTAPHLEVSEPAIKVLEDDEIMDDSMDFQTHELNKLDSNIFKTKHRSSKNGEILKYRKKL